MRFTACDCPAEHYRRERRSAWMRVLFPSRRLYQCLRCNQMLFIQSAPAAENQFLGTVPPEQAAQEDGERHPVA